ncbi:MAG: carbon-nitrogen hydrolase family protein, partial [Bacteroidetes bacterium]|nr:carbon-nitrogen hydrolase family protein [Bacteroidota bacterium]
MKLALVQQRAAKDISANINKAVTSVKEAAKKGGNIICFAELAFTPFYPQNP